MNISLFFYYIGRSCSITSYDFQCFDKLICGISDLHDASECALAQPPYRDEPPLGGFNGFNICL